MKYDLIAIAFSKPSQDARLLNLVRTLKELGISVIIISLYDKYFEESNETDYKAVNVQTEKRILIQWNDFISKGKKILRNIDCNIVLASDLYSLPLASFVKSKRKAKLIYDSREIYSALGSLSNNSTKQKFQNEIEKFYVKNADEIIVSGELDAEYLKKYFAHETKYNVIMNLPPKTSIPKSNVLYEKFNISSDKKIILYQGALLEGRGLEQLFSAMNYIESAVLIIMGKGPKEDFYKNICESNELGSKVIFAGEVPYDSLPLYTASATIGAALFQPVSDSYKFALPNKLFEYIMAEIPVIASNLPAILKIYSEFNFGILVEPGLEGLNLATKINELLENSKNFKEVLKVAKEIYNYESQKHIISEIFEVGK